MEEYEDTSMTYDDDYHVIREMTLFSKPRLEIYSIEAAVITTCHASAFAPFRLFILSSNIHMRLCTSRHDYAAFDTSDII